MHSPHPPHPAVHPAGGSEPLRPDQRFRMLVEGIRDYAIFMLDVQGWVTTWNIGAERMKGYAPEEIIGRHFSMFYPPEEVERGKPNLELITADLTGRFEEEGWRLRKDGSRFWAHVILTALRDGAGNLLGFAKITQDLTARRQVEETLRRSEARLSGIIASAMDAIISVNEDQRVVVFNAAAEAMFGCAAHEAVGQPLERFIPQRYRDAHSQHIRAFGQTGVTSRSMWRPGTLLGVRAQGEEFPIEATISQVVTGGQKFYTVILRDVTERVRQDEALRQQAAALEAANQELTRLAAEAQAANKAKADFLAMISHELRTPLNAIGGYAELLEMELRGPLTKEQAVDVERIRRSQRHLLALINNLLNFARIEAGQIEYALREVRLREQLEEIGELIELKAREKTLGFDNAGLDDSVIVRADPDKLRQVLLNLLGNAVKFTPTGGRIGVKVEGNGSLVMVRVWDTGRGIPPERQKHVFEPFVQIERSLTHPAEGVGLGLAISRDLARGMGGELTCESEPGRGSTFTLVLPRAS